MNIIFLTALLTFIANGVGVLSGFGTGTLMTPILLFFLPYPQTILLVCIIVWFHNVWKMLFFRHHIRWHLVIFFGLPGVVTTYVGALLVGSAWQTILPSFLGAFLLGYVIFIFFFPNFKIKHNSFVSIIGGSIAGFFAGLFGSKGPIRTVFFDAYNLPKEVFLGTAGAISILIDTSRFVTYVYQGIRLNNELLWGLLMFIPLSYAGAKSAQCMVKKIPQKKFRFIVALFLLVVGIKLLFFPV
jgi:uncharacterized membrane protein YfcA